MCVKNNNEITAYTDVHERLRTVADAFLGAEEPSWKPFLKRRGRVFMCLFSPRLGKGEVGSTSNRSSSSANAKKEGEDRVNSGGGGGGRSHI